MTPSSHAPLSGRGVADVGLRVLALCCQLRPEQARARVAAQANQKLVELRASAVALSRDDELRIIDSYLAGFERALATAAWPRGEPTWLGQWYLGQNHGGCMNELDLKIDHISLSVDDLSRAKSFYAKALAPLGLEIVGEVTAEQSGSVAFVGFGIGRKGSLWLANRGRQTPAAHICFRAPTRAAVRDFHRAALEAGAEDNGRPAIRHVYHPAYYAAFVLSPEGHNIEAVCFDEE